MSRLSAMRSTCFQLVLLGSLLASIGVHSVAQESSRVHNSAFVLDNLYVEPGEKLSGRISIPALNGDEGTFIPVTVINGAHEGPVLSLIAGVHGSEYSPILAMQSLTQLIDPSEMNGTLIVVHIANLPSFQGRTIYVSPVDKKNLNRSFPGDSDGTLTSRIAMALTSNVIDRSDFLIDIHSGDGNESLRPAYAAYYKELGDDELIRQSRQLALNFGLDTIVRFPGGYDSVDEAIYTSAQALLRGVPAIDIESGELGIIQDRFIQAIADGAKSVMRGLGMLDGAPSIAEAPIFIDERARIYSEIEGVWYPDTNAITGEIVTEGTTLGYITDYHGNRLEEVKANATGILLILFGTPPVNVGDNIAVIGKLP